MNDHEQIAGVVQIYFDCMHESDADKCRRAFHPNARITGYLPDGFVEMTVEQFAGFVASQQPSPKASGVPALLETVSCEIAGDTAAVRVRDEYLGMTFLDTLSFIRVEGQWSIYNKLFHVERVTQAA